MATLKNQSLPVGYILQDYIITRVLSTGGFSFVYLAQDMNKNIVAIKEASGNLDQVDQILELCDITVLSGEDSLTLPMMVIGWLMAAH